jgi:superfamily I DNA and/or RNA helicase
MLAVKNSFILKEQFRMPPLLSAFPSKAFYKGRVKDHPSVNEGRNLPEGFPWAKRGEKHLPLLFVDTSRCKKEKGKTDPPAEENEGKPLACFFCLHPLLASRL